LLGLLLCVRGLWCIIMLLCGGKNADDSLQRHGARIEYIKPNMNMVAAADYLICFLSFKSFQSYLSS
jgi:hypothetical protein